MCYGRNERDTYWHEVKYILGQIPKNDIVIWTADNNNGQIANPETITDRGNGIDNNAHIGSWQYANQTEKGNGENLLRSYTNTN